MGRTDALAFLLIHVVLVVAWITFLVKDLLAYSRVRWGKPARITFRKGKVKTEKGFANLEIRRGEQSMNSLYVLYGVATLVLALCVQVAEAAQGHKVLIIVLDYLVFSYLFFYSTSFRNMVFFRELQRIQKD